MLKRGFEELGVGAHSGATSEREILSGTKVGDFRELNSALNRAWLCSLASRERETRITITFDCSLVASFVCLGLHVPVTNGP